MQAVDQIRKKLEKYPDVEFELEARPDRGRGRLEIKPRDEKGFPVALIEAEDRYTVLLGRSHWHFRDREEALEYLAFGLTRKCRLRELIRGRPYRWIIEQEAAGGWTPMHETGNLLFRFWRRRTERIYQNDLFG